MHEWNPVPREHGEQADLESRLAAFYGAELREQPLPESSWLHLRTNLEPQRLTLRQRLWQGYHSNRYPLRPGLMRQRMYRRGKPLPAQMRDAFTRLVDETHQPHPLPILHCSFKSYTRVPTVSISPLGRHNIKLILPSNAAWALEPSELDVLLATGLARRFYVRKPANLLLQLLFVSIVLLACIPPILISIHKFSPFAFLIALVICAIVLGLVHIQRCRRAFQADALIVQWLGRSRACQGLHALANRRHSRRRGGWGEPSLAQRIHRVCGTQVTIEDDRLILVR